MMKNYKKRILLSVTGMSPAIVTETLYALVVEKGFIPTEIRLITTLMGKERVLKTLLGINKDGQKEKKGALEEFIEDYGEQYGISSIHFDESCIEIIEDNVGNELEDIRTPEENKLAADKIVRIVGELCQDENAAIHASIAGGRKTMGFFIGYALSLYGRKQDSLSHVLVSSGFENSPDFHYPKPYSHKIKIRDEELDASEGKVMLAEIPWVRLGLGLPSNLLKNRISYSDSVDRAQQLLEKATLKFLTPIDDRKVRFGKQKIKLDPRSYAFLLSVVISKMEDWDYSYSQENNDTAITRYSDIYEIFTGRDKIKSINIHKGKARIKKISEEFRDARTELRKKFEEEFGISESYYIPSSDNQCIELFIAVEDIDITEIKSELKHFKLLSN